ncbi:hypothetical protein ABN154_31085, partial [Klebsiella michiganensis]
GAQYEMTRNFNITTEFGFAERNSFFIAGEYRFCADRLTLSCC